MTETTLVKPVITGNPTGVIIAGTEGRPLPPSEVVRRLQEFDPAMDVRFINGVRGWAVCRRWKDDDPRRLLIRQGDIDPTSDYTILTFLPADCSVEDAFGYIVSQARRQPTDKEYWDHLVDELLALNEKQSDTAAEKALEEVSDYIDSGMGFGRSEMPRSASAQMDNRPPTPTFDTLNAIDVLVEKAEAPVEYVPSMRKPPAAIGGHYEIPASWKRAEDGAEWNPARKRWITPAGTIAKGSAPVEATG